MPTPASLTAEPVSSTPEQPSPAGVADASQSKLPFDTRAISDQDSSLVAPDTSLKAGSITQLGDSASVPLNPVSAEPTGAQWLAQQPANNFTLQLMVSSRLEGLRKLVAGKQFPQPLAIALFTQKGKQLHVLLSGSYPTREAAARTAEELKSKSGVEPWIRSFGSLPPLVAEDVPAPAMSRNRKVSGAAWLWSRNPEHLTMQLLGASSVSRVRSYLHSHEVDGELALIRVERGGKPWYLLLSGEFASSDEAAQALAALPASLKEASPWERSFASLQDEMMNPLRVSH